MLNKNIFCMVRLMGSNGLISMDPASSTDGQPKSEDQMLFAEWADSCRTQKEKEEREEIIKDTYFSYDIRDPRLSQKDWQARRRQFEVKWGKKPKPPLAQLPDDNNSALENNNNERP